MLVSFNASASTLTDSVVAKVDIAADSVFAKFSCLISSPFIHVNFYNKLVLILKLQ